MTATRAQVLDRARALGVEIVDGDGGPESVEALCPKGKRFSSIKTHMLRAWYGRNVAPTTKAEAWGMLLDDMADGVEDCEEPDCDYCTEEE